MAILDRVLRMELCEGGGLPALDECQSEARQIREQVLSVPEEKSPLLSPKMQRRMQAFFSLLVMIESPESLNDDRWLAGQTLVAEEFGNTLAVAGARRKLRIGASAPSSALEIVGVPVSEGSPLGSPSPGVEGSDANEFVAERPYGLTEEEIGKEVDEILAELMEQGPEPMGGQGWNVLVGSSESSSLTEQERSQERSQGKYPREDVLPEELLATSGKRETDHPDRATLLSSIATVHHKKGRHDQAESPYQQALLIRKKGPERCVDVPPGLSCGVSRTPIGGGVGASEAVHRRQRRSGRIIREFAIQVAGTDAQGRDFLVPSKTLDLSRYGAKILLNRDLVPDQEISVCCPDTGKDWDARVVALCSKEPEGHTYGIEFLFQDASFWNISFPPAPGLDGHH